MSNSRDIGALVIALLEAHGADDVEVFAWPTLRGNDPAYPSYMHPPAVGKVSLTKIEHNADCSGIQVLTSDNRRFNIVVFNSDE